MSDNIRSEQVEAIRGALVGREVEVLTDRVIDMVGICTEVSSSPESPNRIAVYLRDGSNARMIAEAFENEAVEGQVYAGSRNRRRVQVSQRLIFVTTRREWEVYERGDDGKPKRTLLDPGRYQLERIANPFGFDAPWFVLKGTQRGMAEGSWRQWADPGFEEFECVFEEDTTVRPR